MTMIKICGLTVLEDARWAWRCGADLLGFIFVPSSPRYIAPEKVARITEALTAEGCQARFVGVFAGETVETVQQIASTCSLHLVQLHGEETADYVRRLGLPAIIARRVRDHVAWDELATAYRGLEREVWAYLLDSYDPHRLGGTGQVWNWDLLPGSTDRPLRWIIAGGLTPDNVALALRRARPWGVDVSSGVEASPGRKDPARVARFIQQIREEENKL